MRLRSALLLVLFAAAMVSGCGDGESDEPAAGSEVERADYAEQVNAICEESSADVEAATTEVLEAAPEDVRSTDFVADSLEAALPITQEATAEAAALPRPPADDETLEDFWARIEDSYPVYEQLIEAIRAEDRGAFSRLNADFAEIAADTRPVAEELGLTSCIPDAPSP